MLMKFRRLLLGTRSRIEYDAAFQIYTATDEQLSISFLERNRTFLYDQGIRRRVETLSRQYFLDKVTFRPNDVIVDCGANIGELSYFFSALPFPVRYIAYEPSRAEFACLKRNAGCFECHNAALWNEVSEKTLFVSSFGADSSLIEPNRYEERTTIRTVRLDEELFGPIRLFKLEAEGAEPEVIQGCENLLARIDYITADLGPERGLDEENTVAAVTNYLLSRNFELVAVATGRIVLLFRNRATT